MEEDNAAKQGLKCQVVASGSGIVILDSEQISYYFCYSMIMSKTHLFSN